MVGQSPLAPQYILPLVPGPSEGAPRPSPYREGPGRVHRQIFLFRAIEPPEGRTLSLAAAPPGQRLHRASPEKFIRFCQQSRRDFIKSGSLERYPLSDIDCSG
ncbi:hypothetical protein NDU88_006358 [Pleurodeles waltl]|uniref:Uncharacterized protein n=1 Tax=Pleurodeles waltl TaxID=8319 RepID=A0AAV7UM79_PLEWA|nr:hypothetical protein NDU88_006358 [Pleurodeles waltl]